MTHTPAPGSEDAPLHFTFNGAPYRARQGETLAAALLRAGVRTLGQRPGAAGPRGAFCWMGWCQDCRVLCQGRWTEACRLPVHEGLIASTGRERDDG